MVASLFLQHPLSLLRRRARLSRSSSQAPRNTEWPVEWPLSYKKNMLKPHTPYKIARSTNSHDSSRYKFGSLFLHAALYKEFFWEDLFLFK
jgi:hypothetical protein